MDARTAVVALDNREKDCRRAFYIPIWALEVTDNDFQTAMFLKQVVFWSQRTDNPDGFYKTYDEWIEESRLNRYRVEKAVKIMNAIAGVELITVTNKKVNGTPKLHYRLNWEALYSLICERCASLFADVEQIRFAEGAQMDLSTSAQIQYKESDRDIQTEKQTESADSFYSSDQPPAVAQEEKEIIQFPVSSGIDELILKLAHLTGVNVESNNPLARQIQVTLQGNIRDIKRIDPDVKATDFDRFPEYYQLQKPSRPRPTAGYVVVGWKAFKEWLQANQAPEPVAPVFVEGTLPGVGKVYAENYLWNSVADMRFWESSWLFEAKDESGNEIQFRWVEDRWVSVEQVAQVAS